MTCKLLYGLWAALFAVCAALGFVSEPEGLVEMGMKLLTVAFFVPGWVILYRAKKEHNDRQRKTVRNICLVSLSATVVTLALNVMSVNWSETAGEILHAVLTVVSAPMVCGGAYLLSLFLWGCLLMGSISKK